MSPNYEAPDGAWYDSPEEYFWIGVLGGCGCGNPDTLALKAYALLEHFGTPHMERSKDLNVYDEVNEVLTHWMDSKELIEHGTSIGGSWLTDKGKELLKTLKEAKSNDN